MNSTMVQSTSLLFGWLFFHGHLADYQREEIIGDLELHGRNMRQHYEDAYNSALHLKLMNRNNADNKSNI